MDRIKSLRQKEGAGYTDPIPFGTDGILVDMSSGLNNEEEFKIGGNTLVGIESDPQDPKKTIIREYFKDITGVQDKYTTKTTIEDKENETEIIIELYENINNSDTLLRKKIITIPNTVGEGNVAGNRIIDFFDGINRDNL